MGADEPGRCRRTADPCRPAWPRSCRRSTQKPAKVYPQQKPARLTFRQCRQLCGITLGTSRRKRSGTEQTDRTCSTRYPSWHAPALTTLLLLAAFFLPGTLALLPLRTGWPAAVALGPAVTLLLYMAGTFAAAALHPPVEPGNRRRTGCSAGPAPLAHRQALCIPHTAGSPALPASTKVGVGAGLAVGSVLTCRALLRGIGNPGTASPGWDPIFHLNALRWIQESGNATPWGIAPYWEPAGRPITPPAGTARWPFPLT